MIKQVRDTIQHYGMTDQGDVVIVAVSGGPDSICLLNVLNELARDLDISLVVAHFNHGLRNGEDESETKLVSDISASLGLPCKVGNARHLEAGSASLEEKARDARYEFFEEVRKDFNAQKIALGHTMNDQAETVIMRLLRGSGLSGLSGIPPVRDNRIIRPLIEISREDIMGYIRERNLPYALDSSNRDTRYLRNSIRMDLLPRMLEYQPRLIENLGRLSAILREDDEFLELMAAEWMKKESQRESGGNISVPVSTLEKLHASFRNRIIRLLLRRRTEHLRRIESGHIQSISDLIDNGNPQAMLDLPAGITVRKIYDRLIFFMGQDQPIEDYSYTVRGPGTMYLKAIDRTLLLEEIEPGIDIGLEKLKTTAYLDAGEIQFPLTVRNFRPGDRFVPLGMNGHKKVKDFFIELKIPSSTRALTPVLISQDTILWICGHRIDDRFKVTAQTKKILKVTIS